MFQFPRKEEGKGKREKEKGRERRERKEKEGKEKEETRRGQERECIWQYSRGEDRRVLQRNFASPHVSTDI